MTTSYRRPRGSAVSNVQLNTLVPADDKELVFTIAKRMGVSTGEAMEMILGHLRTELQDDGLPTWFDRTKLHERLPIAKAS